MLIFERYRKKLIGMTVAALRIGRFTFVVTIKQEGDKGESLGLVFERSNLISCKLTSVRMPV